MKTDYDKTKSKIQEMRKAIQEALTEVGKNHGYDLELGKISYNTDGNLSAEMKGTPTGNMSEDQKRYEYCKRSKGLPDYGSSIVIDKVSYVISGINRTGTKVILSSANGKFLVPTEFVIRSK